MPAKISGGAMRSQVTSTPIVGCVDDSTVTVSASMGSGRPSARRSGANTCSPAVPGTSTMTFE